MLMLLGALYAAAPEGYPSILLSAVGIDEGDNDFSHYRRLDEQAILSSGGTAVRAGLVIADTSYGGTSLARALAAIPWAVPVVGKGDQAVNPIHASDLADCLIDLMVRLVGALWRLAALKPLVRLR